MRYVYELTIPADTSITDPATGQARLVTGRIRQIEIAFPPGPAAMVKVVILDRLLQISPANSEMYHAWDDYTEVFSMNYKLDDPEPTLTLSGWSVDTKYSHKITFRFDVVPKSGDEKAVLMAQMLAAPVLISRGE